VGSAVSGAVNIGVPFITFAVAVAAMFSKGGATVAAIRMGRGDREGANHAFMTAVALTLLVSLLLTAAGMMFCEQIIGISGGRTLSGAMRDMAEEYLFYTAGFPYPC
jgi:Na+-driven multidrug efflux pump